MIKDILILEDFFGTGKIGKLFFSRYINSNPALFFIDEDNLLTEFSINVSHFYQEYPFGEYSLIVIRNKSAAEKLFEAGVVNAPVFNIDNEEGGIFPVCEISDQVIDLLKEEGRFYV